MSTITLAMIVRNEAHYLAACLDSVKDHVDEIVIVDTGSTDHTLHIAAGYTDKIYPFPWQGNFSEARNYAIGQSTGEWILSLDADERLVCPTGHLKEILSRDPRIEAYMLPLDYQINEQTGEYNRFLVLRLFKNKKEYFFTGPIHEQVVIQKKETVGQVDSLHIQHTPVSAQERNRKRGRNLTSLKKACAANPEDPFLQYYLGVEWLGLGKPRRALPLLQKAYRHLTDEHILVRAPALRYLLLCLNAMGRFDQTICLGQEAALAYPDYTDIYYLTGLALSEKQEYKLAVKWLEQSVQCGVPPAYYSHMQGSGGFLAYYHKGYCHEKLGQEAEAKACYEKALRENHRFFYPVGSLFLLLLRNQGARRAVDYFKGEKFFNHPPIALTLAEMLFALGSPGMARECLEGEVSTDSYEEILFQRGKYHIYCGDFRRGLIYFDLLPENSIFLEKVYLHKALALWLSGAYQEGRELALTLWKNPGLRPLAKVLLEISSRLQQDLTLEPKEHREGLEFTEASLLFDLCGRYLPDLPAVGCHHLKKLTGILQNRLLGATGGVSWLDEYYKDKIQGIQECFHSRFGWVKWRHE
ncbi:glycosyltransferase [Desulforamulus ruminis]|uniref:Glycosyl transferase family 2 n=1 Tax=Desulforamulus ruminis (strain ATCC 23193 / DSM 2154 / NCIMB 8452 / DL) TaxID=696281 RepID=F6DN54_DESRL|nr:glycosyltransferase [Desulforamulus ruminis]AEG60643.1 glycosyl transferase family 2 [Desulforamulus ruminis DSM 2154]